MIRKNMDLIFQGLSLDWSFRKWLLNSKRIFFMTRKSPEETFSGTSEELSDNEFPL